jgi:hypothetical protein
VDVRLALLTILATVPVTGCTSPSDPPSPELRPPRCNAPREQFKIQNTKVTAARLDELVKTYQVEGWHELDCDRVCAAAYDAQRHWIAREIKDCILKLPEHRSDSVENPSDGAASASVSCTGTGYKYLCEGRRPLGHVEGGDADCGDPLGRSLAAMAYLEAASVLAFEQLAEQLCGWGAPDELLERCRIAANEERAHARWLTMLAEGHGAAVPRVEQTPAGSELFDVALHNAVEGCVHETFAALLAGCRARRAVSPVLRLVFAKIAVDEAGHGQLAWDVHAWLLTRLAPEEATAVIAAQQLALARLPERGRELATLPAELGLLADAESLALALRERLAA